MTPEVKASLLKRNANIIDIILKKISKCCPKSVDIVGIAGSFATGEFDEKSDLDLCIITNDPKANIISKCFLLNDVAFDIYCTPWEKMEEMSRYGSPYVSKLLNLEIVYSTGSDAVRKYHDLRNKLHKNMAHEKNTLNTALSFFDRSFKEYAMLMLGDNNSACWFSFYQMATSIKAGLFIINGEYIKKGIKDVPSEIATLRKLPDNFVELYKLTFKSGNIVELKGNTTKLALSIRDYVKTITTKTKEMISSQKIIGTYEEISSNWKNKVERAEKYNDIYSQFMAMASCQNFYNELNLKDIDILKNFGVRNIEENSKSFMQGMKEWTELYEQTNTPISTYSSTSELERAYLK